MANNALVPAVQKKLYFMKIQTLSMSSYFSYPSLIHQPGNIACQINKGD